MPIKMIWEKNNWRSLVISWVWEASRINPQIFSFLGTLPFMQMKPKASSLNVSYQEVSAGILFCREREWAREIREVHAELLRLTSRVCVREHGDLTDLQRSNAPSLKSPTSLSLSAALRQPFNVIAPGSVLKVRFSLCIGWLQFHVSVRDNKVRSASLQDFCEPHVY